MSRTHARRLSALSVALIVVAGCGPAAANGPAATQAPPVAVEPVTVAPAAPLVAVAEMSGPADSTVRGTVTFTQEAGRVRLHAEFTGVPGEGAHGFHLHEKGDCSAPDFSSAGGHFNPGGTPHAGPHDTPRHAGDFGVVPIGPDGRGSLDLDTDLLTVEPGPASVVGRGLILHAAPDDFVTQPSGNSGARIACGVVELRDAARLPDAAPPSP
jgi:superoxide dismutase, Cu-Zn family